jgi:PAS domain S-box-containing protein
MTDKAIKDSEARYLQILDTAPDAMVVVGRDETIAFVNAQTEVLFGYKREDLLGKPLDTLIPQRFRGAHGAHVVRYFSRPDVRSMGSGLELFGLRADGTEIAIEVSLSPVEIAEGVFVSAAIRDITERKRLEAIGRINAERLASAVESIQDAFALFDANLQLVLCNSVYRSLIGDAIPGAVVGKSYDHIIGATVDAVGFESEAERARFLEQRLGERGDPRGAVDVRTRDGRRLRITSRRTLEGGIVQTIWDLTDDVQREEDLRQARAAAEAGSAAKSDFLSSMSHELRTPLNAILGFAQLLQRDKREPLSARHTERVDQILKGGEHLLRLIDDILDLSRIEAGGVSISTEPVSVNDVLDEVRRTLGPMAARNGIAIEIEALAATVAADRTRFAQILMNFGSNAIKYNRPNGKVTFTVSVPPSHDRVRVTVSDTGLGIAAEQHDKLFQPFQRAGQEMGPIEGTGIGLVITKRLAELMSGSVGFRSVAGKGSDFWIDLPAHESRLPVAVPQPVDDPRAAGQVDDVRRLVLYVEDNPANVTFMKDLVSTFDFIDLVTAPTAEMGVELARARRPEVVIMDINLPGMSGFDALRVLREWPETKEIPVIALTAAASDRDKQRGLAAGFYKYLTKPVKVDELLEALEGLLKPK